MKDLSPANISKVAFKLLNENGITRLPVDVIKLAKNLGITLVKYSEIDGIHLDELLEGQDDYDATGFYEVVDGKDQYFIYYDDYLTSVEIRLAIAREIVHFVFDMESVSEETATRAENYFILYLLVPSASMFFLKDLTIEHVCNVYGVNSAIAENAIEDFGRRLTKFGPRFFNYEKDGFLENLED